MTLFPQTPSLLAAMAEREAATWHERFGLPTTGAELALFASHIARMASAAHCMAARARMAERRHTTTGEATP